MSQQTYFIRDTSNNLIKIGKSVDPPKRMSEFQTHHAAELQLLAIYPDDVEEYLHEKFQKHHVRGEWFQPSPEIRAWIEKQCGSGTSIETQLREQSKWLLFQNLHSGDVGIVKWTGFEPDDAESEIREKHLRPKANNKFCLLGTALDVVEDDLRPTFGYFGDDPITYPSITPRDSYFLKWAWSYASNELSEWLSVHCPSAIICMKQHYWTMVWYSDWKEVEYIGFTRTDSRDVEETSESVMQQFHLKGYLRECNFNTGRVAAGSINALGQMLIDADCADLRSRFKHLHSYSPIDIAKFGVRYRWDWFQATHSIIEWIRDNRIDDGVQAANELLSKIQENHIPPPI
tara:strand:+ start:870 stop:1904 length:1035 start_codon:yes stop_codon:yes gene_type:complete